MQTKRVGQKLEALRRRARQIPRQVFVTKTNRRARVYALMGKYAFVETSSDEHGREKQREIELEG